MYTKLSRVPIFPPHMKNIWLKIITPHSNRWGQCYQPMVQPFVGSETLRLPNRWCKGLSTIWRWMKYSTAIRILFFLVRSCSSSSMLWLQDVLFCVSVFYQYHILIFYPLFSHSYSYPVSSILFSSLPLQSSAVAASLAVASFQIAWGSVLQLPEWGRHLQHGIGWFQHQWLQTFASRSHVSRQSLLGQAAEEPVRCAWLCSG